ncbi:succinylglutamate desuccinylase/aspartoacylase family protein [Marinobacteraceae bacterium S3BR75-40.1]
MPRASFLLGDEKVPPGSRRRVELPIAKLYTHTPLHIPVEVVHGRRNGPTLLVCGAVHGDEINGVEIVRRLLRLSGLRHLRGTLLAVPIVNVFGFLQQSRYLPDRRDLNRCFPGSEKGSLGGRMAHVFRTNVVDQASHIIDLHTGAIHRYNLPQIRAELKNEETKEMAQAFGAPIILNASLREGTLREYADQNDIPVITYEAGEALRFDEVAIRSGVRGVTRVMRSLGMLKAERRSTTGGKRPRRRSEVASSSTWMRADIDGILRPRARIGERVRKGQKLATVADPFGDSESPVVSALSGIVIGMNNLPLVNEGEALYHVARFDELDDAEKAMDHFRSQYGHQLAPEEPLAPTSFEESQSE